MILKELQINNFLSHENSKIAFEKNQRILLDGKSGSGKSAITEAILWCLFGKGRTDGRSLIRRGAKVATVTTKYATGELDTVISRSVSSTGKNTLAVTQNTGSRGQFIAIKRVGTKDLQDWIEKDFLKASYELFTNSVAYPQENDNSFVKATAGRRKDLLLEIVRAGNFDELYDKVRTVISENKIETTEVVTKIMLLDNEIKSSQEIEKHYDEYKKKGEDLSTDLEIKTLLEKELESQLSGLSDILRQIEEKNTLKKAVTVSWASIITQIERDQKTLDEHVTIDIEKAREDVKEIEIFTNDQEVLIKELGDIYLAQQKINNHLANKPQVNDYGPDIETMNKRLIPLIQSSGSCPAGDKCPFVVPIKGQIEFLSQQIVEKTEKARSEKIARELWEQDYALMPFVKDTNELNTQIKGLKDKINVLSPSKEAVMKFEMFEETRKQIEARGIELKTEKTKLLNEIATIGTQIRGLEDSLVKVDTNKINIDLASTRILIQQLKQSRDEYTAKFALASKAKETVAADTIEIIGLRSKEIKLNEDNECLELLKEALGPRGIKAVVIDYLVPQLEERINEMLSQMSDFRIRLDTQKATVDEEGVKEGLFITVLNDMGEELPFDSYSGGEKVKITIAISEALASLMNQVDFRIMDENIVSLDSESTENFVRVLNKLQEKFPQLIIVSHLQEVKDIFEKTIMVTKVNGVSKLSTLYA